jgi:hypothetical protein
LGLRNTPRDVQKQFSPRYSFYDKPNVWDTPCQNAPTKKPAANTAGFLVERLQLFFRQTKASPGDQWNCSSSVEPVKAVTLDLPP